MNKNFRQSLFAAQDAQSILTLLETELTFQLALKAGAVLSRRQTKLTPEDATKIIAIRKTATLRHFMNRQMIFLQNHPRLRHSHPANILDKTHRPMLANSFDR